MSVLKPVLGSQLQLGHPLAKGLVGCWLFNENPSNLGKVYDLSGNGNTGSLVADTHGVPGKFGPALDFDGASDYVDCGTGSSLDFDAGTQDFSVFGWVKFVDPSAGNYSPIHRSDASNDGWELRSIGGQIWLSVDTKDTKGSTIISDTDWHHIGATIDRDGNGQVYLDGVKDGSPTAIASEVMITTASTKIGHDGSGSWWNGQIDNVMIWNRALSPQEIANLYVDSFQMVKQEPIELWTAAKQGVTALSINVFDTEAPDPW